MTIDERRKYLHKMRLRYWQAKSRRERSQLLNEMEAVTELHRKSLIRLINGELARKPRRRERGRTYGVEVEAAVQVVAESLDYPCAERLQPSLAWMAQHLARHGELSVTTGLLDKLCQISVSTVRRMLQRRGQGVERLAHRKKQPGEVGAQRQAIPVKRIDWAEPHPGHFEVDLVHHCGVSPSGQYVHTLQIVDVTTGWSECAAVLGRSYRVMEDGFQRILSRLPFAVLEIHPDNGGEFFYSHLLHFWKDKVQGVELSRSRPYQKNDNRFVEENNYSLVRAYVGYQRLDTVAQTNLLNQLLDKLWLYHNFFQPVMRLKQKIAIPMTLRSKRIYDDAQPPFDRLCAKGVLEPATQVRLQALRDATNPRQLRNMIEELTSRLFALPGAKEGITEDVHQTLGLWQTVQSPMAG